MNLWNLEVGSTYLLGESLVRVERFVGHEVLLRDEENVISKLSITEFVRQAAQPADSATKKLAIPLLEDIVGPQAIKKAQKLQHHLEIVLHGFDSQLEDGPNDPDYNPETTTMTERIKRKAAELGRKPSALFKMKRRYKNSGIVGLLDGRSIRDHSAERRDSSPLYLSIAQVLRDTHDASKKNNKTLYELIEATLLEHYPEAKLPSVSTLNRLLRIVKQELRFQGSPRQRQKRALEPRMPFGQFRAIRPGQVVLFDANSFDLLCFDIKSMQWVKVVLVLAFDVYSRSIVAWRFIPQSAKALDAALLLFDLLNPKPALPDWPDCAQWRYFGVPADIWVLLRPETNVAAPDAVGKVIAGIPVITPQTVVTDHDKIFVSRSFQHVCATLGITIHRARIRRPTDKSMIENVFGYINENFAARLPGYKGADVASRGIDIEKSAFYFLEEIDAMFAEWVATDWQNHVSRTLILPELPALRLSPNDAYAEGLAKSGIMPIPTQVYFDCLDTEYRVVESNGITVDYLSYDSVDLNYYRFKKSSLTEDGKFAVKVDPRDRSQIYFFSEHEREWWSIPWRGTKIFPKPFGDIALGFAKTKVMQRFNETSPNDDDMARALKDLYKRWRENRFDSNRERRAFGRSEALSEQASQDRQRDSAKAKATQLPSPENDLWVDQGENVSDALSSSVRSEGFSTSRSVYESFDHLEEDVSEEHISTAKQDQPSSQSRRRRGG